MKNITNTQNKRFNILNFIVFIALMFFLFFLESLLPKNILLNIIHNLNAFLVIGAIFLIISGFCTSYINSHFFMKQSEKNKALVEIISNFIAIFIFAYIFIKTYQVVRYPGAELMAVALIIPAIVFLFGFLFSIYKFIKSIINYRKL